MKKLFTILIGLFWFFGAIAQETTSEIQGRIADDNGPLPGATIIALHQPTGTRYVTTTRKDGYYNLNNVKIGGPYKITVSFVGYETFEQNNINLVLGQEFTADFKMVPSDNKLDEVVVKGKGQDKVFNAKRTGSEEVINRDQLTKLPTINRTIQDFIKLTPSANPSSVGTAFGGQINQYNNITLDGANFNNSFGLSNTVGGQTNSAPISLDAIEQIQVDITPFDVRNGGFTGAGINTVTRSGTNTFSGTVYDYTKGPGDIGYKVGTTTVPRQTFNYNLWGASVGGPIIKNKLFFFVNVEQEKRTDPGTNFVASSAGNSPNAVSVSNANADTLNALRDFLKSKYGYDPGAYQGYSYRTQSVKSTVRLDWNINEKNSLTFKYNYLQSLRDVQASNSGSANSSYGRTPGQYAMPFYGSGYTINNNANVFLLELNSRFSNNISNKLQVGYTQLRDFRKALSSSDFPLVDILDGNGNPYTSFGYEQYTYGNKLNTDIYQVNDVFTYFKGAHEITIGTQNSFKQYQNGFSPSYEGVYRFNSLADFYASANGTKTAARYDLSYTTNPGAAFPLVGPKDVELGFFAQDKWRVLKNLNVTYGIRFDIPIFSNTFLYNPVVDTLTQFYNGTHVNTGQAPGANMLISPRVGFNWDPFKDHKTQVRGGIGLFSGPPPFVWISNQASNSGVALFGSVSNGQGYMFSPDINKYRPDSAASTLQKSYSINITDPKFKFPQALKSTIAIDRKLPAGFVVTGEYSITNNINAVYFENLDLSSSYVNINNGNDNRPRYASFAVYPLGGSSKTSINNPSIGNAIYMTNTKDGGYAYNATLQVQKNFKNFYANVAYTFSESYDVLIGGSTASTQWGSKPISGNPNDPQVGYSNAYLPHRVIASAYYRKEYGKYFASQAGLIFEAAPYGTYSYTYQGDLNNDGFTSNDLIYIPRNSNEIKLEPSAPTGGVADTRTPAQIWNQLNNFINQDPYLSTHRGQIAQRNALIAPWFKRLDLNLTQDFYYVTKDKTRHTLRFSVDIYNIGNFLNKNWGLYKVPTTTSPLKYDKMDIDGKTPIFSFPYQDGTNQIPLTNSFKNDITLASRWQIQFGFRYLFN